MTAAETFWLSFLGGEIRFRNAGSQRTRSLEAGSGEPLLLLHGNGGHAEIFLRNIGPLATRFRVHAIDLIGHGLSDKPDYPEYLVPHYVRHVLDYLDAIGASDAHLVGHGMAGWIATYLAVHHPERVKSLVSVNGLTRLKKHDAYAEEGFGKLAALSKQAVAQADLESVRKRVAFAVADSASIPEEFIIVRHALYSRPDSAAAMPKVLSVESPEQRKYALTPEELGALRVPVLLIFAEKHPIETLENFQALHRLIPGARLEVIAGAGLLAMWEKPEEFNRLVLEFLP